MISSSYYILSIAVLKKIKIKKINQQLRINKCQNSWMLLIPYTVILVTVFEINCIYFVFKNSTLTPPPFQLWYHSNPGDHDLKKLETFKDFLKYPYENLTPPPNCGSTLPSRIKIWTNLNLHYLRTLPHKLHLVWPIDFFSL